MILSQSTNIMSLEMNSKSIICNQKLAKSNIPILHSKFKSSSTKSPTHKYKTIKNKHQALNK